MHTMSRLRTVAGAAAIVVLLAGCASDDPDTAEVEADEPAGPADDPEEDGAARDTDSADADANAGTESDGDADADADAAEAGGIVATDTVQVRNINFEPADIEVAVGSEVTWINEDIVNHTVTSGPAGEPDGRFDEALGSGDEVTITFEETGTFVYYCDLHRNMVGTVTVAD